jgi:hypothetical protein
MGRQKIQFGSLRHDAGRIDRPMTAVITGFDVIHMHGLGDAGYLIEIAGAGPQVGMIGQSLAVAFEVAVADCIEPNQGGEQPPVRLGDALAYRVKPRRQSGLKLVEDIKQTIVCLVMSGLCGGESGAVSTSWTTSFIARTPGESLYTSSGSSYLIDGRSPKGAGCHIRPMVLHCIGRRRALPFPCRGEPDRIQKANPCRSAAKEIIPLPAQECGIPCDPANRP